MLLHKGMSAFCLLQEANLEDLSLSKYIFYDIMEALPDITQESVGADIFAGLASREIINRSNSGILKGCNCKKCGGNSSRTECFVHPLGATKSFSMICAVLLRRNIALTIKHGQPKRFLDYEDRQKILAVFYDYGIQCADGSCCGITQDPLVRPIEVGPDHRVQLPFSFSFDIEVKEPY